MIMRHFHTRLYDNSGSKADFIKLFSSELFLSFPDLLVGSFVFLECYLLLNCNSCFSILSHSDFSFDFHQQRDTLAQIIQFMRCFLVVDNCCRRRSSFVLSCFGSHCNEYLNSSTSFSIDAFD